MRLIETTQLKTWAGSKVAESRFPYIIKSLICAAIQPDKLRMPSGDAVWLPGFDGELVSGEENQFVPTGLSVWELGTNADFKDKATSDYNKRSKDEEEKANEEAKRKKKRVERKLDRSQITFVFVTPLVWVEVDKQVWIDQRKAEGIWKDIVVIDGVDTQDWLEKAQAVNLQFAAEIGIVPEVGLQTPDQAWEEWSHRTNPAASEELVIIGREEQEKDLIGRLIAPPSTFVVRGDSPHEAWGFMLAALRRVESEEERTNLYARTIIADDEEVARGLQHLKNLIIILKQTRGQVSGYLSSRGCHVVVPEGNDAHSERNVIILGRSSHRLFTTALEKMGFLGVEAEQVTRACGLSVTIFQRQRALANFERPKWAESASVISLLPAILAGRWSDKSQADRGILCRLANTVEYGDIELQLQDFLWVDEPPLQKIGEMWTLTAPVDAFQLIARRLTTAHLEQFKNVFRDVFGRIDPKVELPPEEWIYSDLKGEKGHSGWLRSGMAEALLLIAERGTDARLICIQSPRAYVEEVVRGIPGLNDDWRVLASLRDQYARLMEAAPRPLLTSLEQLLEASPNDVRQLFIESEGVFGGGGMHTGLLWGLETLAWSPEYLPRVAVTFARLSLIDPGGRLSNRPINSLSRIFSWWYPCTNATVEQRLEVLDLILAREPQIGWSLLSSLLPNTNRSVTYETVKPRWRDFGDMPDEERTKRRLLQYLSAIIDRTIERTRTHPERWRVVLDSLRAFSPIQQEKVIALLESIAKGALQADERSSLWEILRDYIHNHRMFREANWSLDEKLLDRLESIVPYLTPDDLVERYRWLFEDWLPKLPSGDKDFDQRERNVQEQRQLAISEILQTQGLKGIATLGTTCKYPGFVAVSVVPLISSLDNIKQLIELSISAGEAGLFFASHISGQAERLHEDLWRELVRKEATNKSWSSAAVASLLVWWPDNRVTWDEAVALGEGVASEYWRRKRLSVLDGLPEDQTYQIDQIIKVDRVLEAFVYAALSGTGVPTEALVRLFDATLDRLVQVQTDEDVRQLRLNSYDVRKFLDELHNRMDLSREELIRREYRALPLLAPNQANGLSIHEFMAESPEFFVNVLCDIFLPAHRDKTSDSDLTPEAQARAHTGFILLQGMDKIPGQDEGDQIDEGVLLQWINNVRKRATEADRSIIADQQIGGILAHAAEDPHDGGWPHRTIRNVIEKLAVDEIERGLIIERHNMRGFYSKALYEGGAQERALAGEYRGWAKIAWASWPRMTRVLEDIAQSWEEYADREDVEAEQDKLE